MYEKDKDVAQCQLNMSEMRLCVLSDVNEEIT